MPTVRVKRTIMGQLPHGSDLYTEITRIIQTNGIRLGRIRGIGATTHARVAYYDQNAKKYNPMEFSGGMEILSLSGNISIREGAPFVHAHIILGDPEGRAFGGHLLEGTLVFAFELTIDEFEGEDLVRSQEERTGLFLWKGGHLP